MPQTSSGVLGSCIEELTHLSTKAIVRGIDNWTGKDTVVLFSLHNRRGLFKDLRTKDLATSTQSSQLIAGFRVRNELERLCLVQIGLLKANG